MSVKAQALGMADKIAELEFTIKRLRAKAKTDKDTVRRAEVMAKSYKMVEKERDVAQLETRRLRELLATDGGLAQQLETARTRCDETLTENLRLRRLLRKKIAREKGIEVEE